MYTVLRLDAREHVRVEALSEVLDSLRALLRVTDVGDAKESTEAADGYCSLDLADGSDWSEHVTQIQNQLSLLEPALRKARALGVGCRVDVAVAKDDADGDALFTELEVPTSVTAQLASLDVGLTFTIYGLDDAGLSPAALHELLTGYREWVARGRPGSG